jgi:hypothetical protein
MSEERMNFKLLLGLAILCGVLLGAGAGAVTSRQRSSGPPASAAAATAGGAQRVAVAPTNAVQQPSTTPAGSPRASGTQPAQALAGTIERIEGNVLTLRLPNGNSVRVVVGDNTVIRRMVPGTIADLSVGQTITVSAERAEDGSATARVIQVAPEGGPSIQNSPPRGQEQSGSAAQDSGDQSGEQRISQGTQRRQGGPPGSR